MGTVYEYLSAVFQHWVALVIALLFGLDEALEWFWPGYRERLNKTFPLEKRRKYFWWALLVFVFLSGFLAWKDEHEKLVNLQKQIVAARTSQKSSSAYVRVTKDGALSIRRNLEGYGLSVKKIEFQGGPAYTLTFEKDPGPLMIEPESVYADVEVVKVGPNTHRVRFVGFDLTDPIIEADFIVLMSALNQ